MIFLKKVVGIFYHGGKQEKKRRRGHSKEHPPNVKVDEQATDKKAINKIMEDK
jgi:hypothetical protein